MIKELSPQQRVLGYAMLHQRGDAILDYRMDRRRIRHANHLLDPREYSALQAAFRIDPKTCQAFARDNLQKIITDTRSGGDLKKNRLERYLEEYFDLIVKLDNVNYPPKPNVIGRGIPEYIPDGLTDMGSNPSLDNNLRTRERLKVNKKVTYRQNLDFFKRVFSRPTPKEDMFVMLAEYEYDTMPYDHQDLAFPDYGGTVMIHQYRKVGLAQCRHHAFETQVLAQALGLTSRLAKVDMYVGYGNSAPLRYLGRHAINLGRVDHQWYVIDVTNPDHKPYGRVVFMKPIDEWDIDLNANTYDWQFPTGRGSVRYQTHHTMYYRITANRK